MKTEILKRGLTAGLAGLLCACSAEPAVKEAAAEETAEPEETVTIRHDEAVPPVRKEETVTVQTDAYGTVTKISSAVELEPSGFGPVRDLTGLQDIRNREGDEEYELTDSGELYWQNLGETIRYEGTGTAELPVEMHVSYRLDGQPVTAAELAGKSGRVTIRFDYTNRTLAGSYIPFLAMTLVLMDEEVFSDIKVTNGRVVKAGGQTAVIGYAIPGLYQAMKMGNYDLTDEAEIPEYVEISAMTEQFSLDFTSTVVSNGVFSEIEDEDLKDLDDLSADMKEMGTSFKDAVDGVGSLKDGMGEFGTGMGSYIAGVNQLCSYAGTLTEMSGTIKEKLPDLLKTLETTSSGIAGMNQMVQALDVPTMEQGTAAALEKFSQDATALQEQLQAMQEAVKALNTALTSVSEYTAALLDQMNQAAELLNDADLSALNTALAQQKTAARDQAAGKIEELDLADEQKAAVLSALDEALGTIDISADVTAAQDEVNTRLQTAAGLLETVPMMPVIAMPSLDTEAMTEVMNDMIAQAEILQAGYGNLGNLPQMTEQLKTSFGQLAAMSAEIDKQTEQYKPQIEALPGQLNELAGALKTLGSASQPLQEGYGKIQDGVQELYDGLKEFNDEAIQEMADIGGYELAGLLGSVRQLRRNDRYYDTYSGLTAGTEGSVRFIYETAEIRP